MKTMNRVRVIMFLFGLFILSAQANAQSWSKEQAAVWQVVESSWKSWQEGDMLKALESFHENYMGWNADSPLPKNRTKVEQMFEGMKDVMKVEWYDIEPARITVSGDAAVVNYYYDMYASFTMGSKSWTEEESGKITEFYIKEGGQWMLLGDMAADEEDDDEDNDD